MEPRTTLRFGFGLEKWYADVFLDDGSVLIATLGRLVLLGVSLDRLSVELHRPDGSRLTVAGRLGRGRQQGSSRTYRAALLSPETLAWQRPGLSGTLRFVPRCPPFAPSDPILHRGVRQLRWLVDQPDADVTGELITPGGRQAVRGRGYRDYVALDLLPWWLRGWDLSWGRAVWQDGAAVWFRLRSRVATVEATWRDGVTILAYRPPDLKGERVIGKALLTDLPILRIGPIRWLLSLLGRRPRLVRSLACRVDGAPGRAIREAVGWQ